MKNSTVLVSKSLNSRVGIVDLPTNLMCNDPGWISKSESIQTPPRPLKRKDSSKVHYHYDDGDPGGRSGGCERSSRRSPRDRHDRDENLLTFTEGTRV